MSSFSIRESNRRQEEPRESSNQQACKDIAVETEEEGNGREDGEPAEEEEISVDLHLRSGALDE